MINVLIWSLLLKYVIGILTLIREPSVSNIHFLDGRLDMFTNFNNLDQCTAECSIDPQCVSVGYCSSTGSCQLYMYDPSNFTINVIEQKDTALFKVVCERSDYTYIRSLSTCMKVYTEEHTFSKSSNVCGSDGAHLLQVDTVEKMAYLNPVLSHISDEYRFYLGGYGVEGTESYKWYGNGVGTDTEINVENGGAFWGKYGAPLCMYSGGCCLTYQSENGTTPLFTSEDCTNQHMFICTIDM